MLKSISAVGALLSVGFYSLMLFVQHLAGFLAS